MSTTTRTEHGVRHADGHVEPITSADANEAYMDPEQLAPIRAKAVHGTVVTRTRTVTTTGWVAAGETVWDRELAGLERAWAESDAAVGIAPGPNMLALRDQLRTAYRGYADRERLSTPAADVDVAGSPA